MRGESGKVKVESGEVKVESGKVKVESGKVKVESGKWKVESGKWRGERFSGLRYSCLRVNGMGRCASTSLRLRSGSNSASEVEGERFPC